MSKSRRKALGEEPLGKKGVLQERYLTSKRRVSGEDPYAWIKGKEEKKKMKKKPKREKLAKPVKRRKPAKLRVKKIVEKPKLPAKIWKKLGKVEKGAVLLPREIMAAAKATGKVTGKLTTDVSRTITSGVVTGPREAKRIIQCLQSKIKAGSLKSRTEELFRTLGKECYGLIGKKKSILKERKIQNLIKKIKHYQKELQKIEEGI